MGRNRWILFAVAIACGAIVGVWLFRSNKVASAAAIEKDLVTVQRADYPILVGAAGIMEAAKNVSIGAPRNIRNERRFKLSRMTEEGKQVSEGDFLLEFDSSDISSRLRNETALYQRQLEEYQKKRSDADIQLRDLRLQVEQAKADYEKLVNKLSQQVELESAITIAETQIRRDVAKRKLELLETKLKSATHANQLDATISQSNQRHYKNHMDALLDAMDAMTVTAPVNGVVIYKRDWNNEARQVGSNIFIMDTVLELPDLSTLRAKVMVDEIDEGKVKIGDEAQIFVDAVQGRIFRGKVASISTILKQASFDRPQKVAETYIAMEGEGLSLVRPGMSARAQIQVGRYPQALVIPLSSIQEKDGKSLVQVWKTDRKEFEWREIELLTNDGVLAVIKSGLEANEKIRSKPQA